jgi:hypothetical protein
MRALFEVEEDDDEVATRPAAKTNAGAGNKPSLSSSSTSVQADHSVVIIKSSPIAEDPLGVGSMTVTTTTTTTTMTTAAKSAAPQPSPMVTALSVNDGKSTSTVVVASSTVGNSASSSAASVNALEAKIAMLKAELDEKERQIMMRDQKISFLEEDSYCRVCMDGKIETVRSILPYINCRIT